jgi:hypothetical protein
MAEPDHFYMSAQDKEILEEIRNDHESYADWYEEVFFEVIKPKQPRRRRRVPPPRK